MTRRRFGLSRRLTALGALAAMGGLTASSAPAGTGSSFSLAVFENAPGDYDYGRQLELPPGFGSAEFTFELWIRPDDSYPVGPTTPGTPGQLINWSDADNPPYSSDDWWYEGNFLLDGHNNANANFEEGTFSLQFYGGGRVRWHFGDGAVAGPGRHWSVEAFPASTTPSLLDGAWHQVTLVRRWAGAAQADLELWVDGALVATETSSERTDMRTYWDTWSAFPPGQEGWFWGAEKQAAIGVLPQYEDYKGLIDEIRFWSRAKTPAEIAADWADPVDGSEPGLAGVYRFDEGMGTTTCDALEPIRCIDLINMKPGFWSPDNPPLGGLVIFADGFESGDFSAWSGVTGGEERGGR